MKSLAVRIAIATVALMGLAIPCLAGGHGHVQAVVVGGHGHGYGYRQNFVQPIVIGSSYGYNYAAQPLVVAPLVAQQYVQPVVAPVVTQPYTQPVVVTSPIVSELKTLQAYTPSYPQAIVTSPVVTGGYGYHQNLVQPVVTHGHGYQRSQSVVVQPVVVKPAEKVVAPTVKVEVVAPKAEAQKAPVKAPAKKKQ